MECRTSKLKVLGLLGLTCVMVAVSWFCTTVPLPEPRVAGWIGVVFFGLGFIVLPPMLFQTSPRVVINDEGIEDRRSKMGLIRWEDIRSVSMDSVHSAGFLRIEVSDPEKYLCRLPRWSRPLAGFTRAMGLPPLTVGFSGLSPGLKEVWAYLQDRRSGLNLPVRPIE